MEAEHLLFDVKQGLSALTHTETHAIDTEGVIHKCYWKCYNSVLSGNNDSVCHSLWLLTCKRGQFLEKGSDLLSAVM